MIRVGVERIDRPVRNELGLGDILYPNLLRSCEPFGYKGFHLTVTVAGYLVTIFHLFEGRFLFSAEVSIKGASCVKPAPMGRVNGTRDVP